MNIQKGNLNKRLNEENKIENEIIIPYGKGFLSLEKKPNICYQVVSGQDYPEVSDVREATIAALNNPIGTCKIRERVKRFDHVAIVVNDITRPSFSDILVKAIVDELSEVGVPDSNVIILVATGTHRPNDRAELSQMLGKNILNRFKVLNHDCRDTSNLIDLGKTPGGTPIVINRHYVEATYRILTGVITPHHTAGFSGGRKSIIPGLAGLEVLKRHHSLPLRPYQPAMGCLDDNLFHLEALAGAKLCGADFILNIVPNSRGEVVAVVAGDLEQAHLKGVQLCKKMCQCTLPKRSDIVITGPGGYPRDINLYQAQKAISAAEPVVCDGGTIILAAECSQGAGEENFVKWMLEASSPEAVIKRFQQEGFVPGANKAFMFARCLLRCRIIVVTSYISDNLLKKMFMERADSLEEALATVIRFQENKEPTVTVIPRSAYLIPEVKEEE